MHTYSLRKELFYKLKSKYSFIWLFAMCIPAIYYSIVWDSSDFRDKLNIFTFLFEGVLIVIFPLLASLIYLPSFSGELRNRFIVYTRLRTPVGKLLSIKFIANGMLTFTVFFVFVLLMFIFAYYIFPSLGWANLHPERYGLSGNALIEDTYTRHTFTQLLEYGLYTYILFYAFWVGINAAVYSSIGFLLLLLLQNKFIAMSIPWLIYIVGSFILISPELRPFRLADTIFPYMYMQQPIWTTFIPFICLCCICLLLYLVVRKKFTSLDDLQ